MEYCCSFAHLDAPFFKFKKNLPPSYAFSLRNSRRPALFVFLAKGEGKTGPPKIQHPAKALGWRLHPCSCLPILPYASQKSCQRALISPSQMTVEVLSHGLSTACKFKFFKYIIHFFKIF